MTLILLIFGEISPKSIALSYNEWIALHTARILQVLMVVFFPVRILVDLGTQGASKLFGGQTIRPAITEDEIRSAITIGEEVDSRPPGDLFPDGGKKLLLSFNTFHTLLLFQAVERYGR